MANLGPFGFSLSMYCPPPPTRRQNFCPTETNKSFDAKVGATFERWQKKIFQRQSFRCKGWSVAANCRLPTLLPEKKNTTAAAACHHCCQISDPTALFFSQIYEKGKLCGSEIASVDLTYNGAGWQWDTEKGIIWVDGVSRFVFLTKFKTSRIGGSSSK